MKKIINWSLGSFFRTIGRIFAYLSIGFLLAIICSKLGINFGFIQVDAATSGLDKYDYRFWPVSCNVNGENCTLGQGSGFLNKNEYYNIPSMYSSLIQFNLRTWAGSNTYNQGNTYTFRYTIQVENKNTLLNNMEEINKSIKFIEMYTSTASSPSSAEEEDINVNIKFTDATGSTDKIYLYIKFSPNRNIKWWGLTFQVGKVGQDITQFPFSNVGKIRYINSKVTYEEGVGAIIDNKTDEIIKEQEKTNDILNNSDITESNSEFNSFFSNFDDGDTGSLMNLISLPLSYLENLKGSCKNVNLPLPYFGNVQLQCMSTSVYNQNNDLKPIFVLVKLLINGIICYKCLKGLIYFIKDLKEPDKDNLEVLDL